LKQVIRLLFIPREDFPTDRVRINVLFGRELLSRGHEIDLVMQASSDELAPGPRPWHGRTVSVGRTDSKDGLLHRLHRQWLGLSHDLRLLLRARARYDGVLISDKFATAAIAALLARARGLKFIFWLTFPYTESDVAKARSGVARYPRLANIRGVANAWLLYKWIMPRADHVFVQSDRMKRSVCAHGVDPAKVSSILTGFDLSGIAPRSLEWRAANAASTTVAYLGTLNAERRLEVLVDMLALLRRGGMNAKLLLVGHSENPRDRRLLEQRAAELDVSAYVEFTGFLPHAEALRRVAEADIGISPIDRGPVFDVGSPTKMIEYMALGMPVVANDHPEQQLILRESRAGVCVPWAARHYARAVRWLMARSPGERAQMGAQGRAWVEQNRTYARIADEVERTCLALLARAGTHGCDERAVRPAARVD
jgi:glycosyltransferase involved in cell wall biosynthesis